jgi:ribosomal protein L22
LNKINLKNNSNTSTTDSSYIKTEKPKLKIIKPHTEISYLEYNIPFITLKKSKFDKEEQKHLIVKSKVLSYSARKIKPLNRVLTGKSVEQAIMLCSNLNSKAAKYAKEYLEKIKKVYENENRHELKYFYIIKEAYVGRKTGTKKPFPRAKGKADMRISAKCRINFKVAKVLASNQLQKLALGEADLSFSEALKCKLFNENASLADIKKNAFFLTAKGRNYRKTQFKRLVFYLKNRYYESYRIKLSSLFVAEEIKKNLGDNLVKYMNMHPISAEEFSGLTPHEKAKSEVRESFFETFVQKLTKQQDTSLDLERRKSLYTEKMRNYQ